MKRTTEHRLAKLETADAPPRRVVVVGLEQWDWTPRQLADARRQAEQDAGPDDTIITVRYTKHWRAPDAAERE